MASSSTFVTTTNPNKWAEEKKQFLKEKFIELIIKVPLFQALSKDNLNRIADSFTEIKFNDKDVIIREGELGEVMYILKSGKVNIYKQMSDESPKPTFIRTLEPPSYFGEYALLASSPRTASVIAASNNCSCYMLHKEAFSCLFPVNKVMRCRQFLESEKIFERHPAFNQLPPLVLSHLRDIMHPAIYSKGDLVAERGTVQKYMICVIEGEVKEIHHGETISSLGDMYGIKCLIDENHSGINSGETSEHNDGSANQHPPPHHQYENHWNHTLETISTTAMCVWVTLSDLKSCLGSDFYPLFVRRSRAYLYHLKMKRKGHINHVLHNVGQLSLVGKKKGQDGPVSLYKSLMHYLLDNPRHLDPMKQLLRHVRWNDSQKALHTFEKVTKRILKTIPFDRNEVQLHFLKLLLRTVVWPKQLHRFKHNNNFYKHLYYTSLGKDVILYNREEELNNGNAYLILHGSIDEIDEYGNVHKIYVEGDIFGVLALSSSTGRKFTACARGKTHLIEIHRTSYEGIMEDSVVNSNRTYEIMELVDFLKANVTPFIDVEANVLLDNVNKCSTHTYMPGHVFNLVGNQLDSVYVILSGQINIKRTVVIKSKYQNIVDDYLAHISTIGKAQWFGISAVKSMLNGGGEKIVESPTRLLKKGNGEDTLENTNNVPSSPDKPRDTSNSKNPIQSVVANTTKSLDVNQEEEDKSRKLLENNNIINPANVSAPDSVEVESYVAKTKVKVLIMPYYILRRLPKRILHCFEEDYVTRNAWRSTITENAYFCRRTDILRTMCDTESLKNVVDEIMLGYEKNPGRPSSPRIIKDIVEDSIRKHRAKPIPSAFEDMQRKRLHNAMTKVHTRTDLNDAGNISLSGSFKIQKREENVNKNNDDSATNIGHIGKKMFNSTLDSNAKPAVNNNIVTMPKDNKNRSKNMNHPSPRKVKFKLIEKDKDGSMDLMDSPVEVPEQNLAKIETMKQNRSNKNEIIDEAIEQRNLMKQMWKINWSVGKPFKQKNKPVALPETIFKDNRKIKSKREKILYGAYNFC